MPEAGVAPNIFAGQFTLPQQGGGADYANQITSRRPPSLQISRTSDILVKSCLFALSAVNLTRNKSLTYGVVRPNVPDQPDPTQPEFGPWGPPDSTRI